MIHRTVSTPSGVNRGRHLFVTPDRQIKRLDYVPAGRSLHLVDVENLMGGSERGGIALAMASQAYRRTAPVVAGDHVIVAANQHLIVEAAACWPGSRVLVGNGPDGADLALISAASDVVELAPRYDRIVIGSGDGIFHDLVIDYLALGLEVGVVATVRSLAHILARDVSFFRLLPEAPLLEIVA